MEKRRFRNSTQQVLAAVQACLRNAVQLGEAAIEQLHAERPGLAVALIVLALEELGKLILADGLAFAQPVRRGSFPGARRILNGREDQVWKFAERAAPRLPCLSS